MKRVGARDRRKIRVAQLELNRPAIKTMLAQAPPNELHQFRQRGVDQIDIGRVFAKGGFVTDGLGLIASSNSAFQPGAGVEAKR